MYPIKPHLTHIGQCLGSSFLGALFGDFPQTFWYNFSVVSHWPRIAWIHPFKLHIDYLKFAFLRVLWSQLWQHHFSDLIFFSKYNFFLYFSAFSHSFIILGKTNPKDILYKIVWFLELNTFYSVWNISLSILVILLSSKINLYWFMIYHSFPLFQLGTFLGYFSKLYSLQKH